MKRTEFNIIRKHGNRVAYKRRQKEYNDDGTFKRLCLESIIMVDTIRKDESDCDFGKRMVEKHWGAKYLDFFALAKKDQQLMR